VRVLAYAARCAAQVSDKVWFTKQTVGNACGTIGLLHAAANLASEVPPAPGSWLAGFLARTAGMDASVRASALAEDDSLDAAHAAAASTGQSAAPADDEEVNLHFVAFVHVDGGLYELDGRKPAPVRHGDTGADSLLVDAVAVVQREFVARADGNVNFNLVALAPPMDD
jgi:ubiquitin carboxyl-terminal hydrolase L3